jgi:hypothetical protein
MHSPTSLWPRGAARAGARRDKVREVLVAVGRDRAAQARRRARERRAGARVNALGEQHAHLPARGARARASCTSGRSGAACKLQPEW